MTSDPVAPLGRDQHLFGPGPKRILALDGGGVRGIVSIAILERLEKVLAEIEGRPVLLGDWFDLIGGTSTGAIIAAGLALGLRAEELRAIYENLAPRVFRRSRYRLIGRQAVFDAASLKREIMGIIGGRTLDSEDLRTGLGVVTKRLPRRAMPVALAARCLEQFTRPGDVVFDPFIGTGTTAVAALLPTLSKPSLMAATHPR